MTDVGSFGGSDNRGLAVGTDDKLYGYSADATDLQRGFVWDGVTLADLGYLAAGDAVLPQAVNASNVITGYTNTGGGTLGFRISGGVMSAIGTLPGADIPATSAAYDINDAGRIVGVASWVGGGTRAFRTDASGAPVSLGTLGANDSFASAINSAGQVAGYSTNASNVMHAFIFNDGTGMLDLGVLSGCVESRAYGMDDTGAVVGACADSAGNPRAFLWMPGAMRDLNDLIPPNSGWVLKEARDINNSGDIVGYGTINGGEHAFLLERFPGPDTFAPVAVATVTQPGQGSAVTQVAVKFWDNEKVVSATARAAGAIRISGPNGYEAGGTAFMWTTNDSQVVNVSFNVPAPGGTWGPDDNGTYEVRVAPNVVSDLAGNRHPGGVNATFTVGLQTTPTLTIWSAPATATVGVAANYTFSATSSYPNAASDVFAFTIDWDGDGSNVETVNAVSLSVIPHIFTSTGSRTVRVHATDPHGVQSSERTASIAVANTAATFLPSEVLATPTGVSSYGTVATVKAGTMYFFGQPFTAASNTSVFTWNYLTPGAGFVTQPDNLDNGPIQPAGAAVDSRGRIIVFGGGEAGGASTSANTYTTAGGFAGGVTALPVAIASAPNTSDSLSRLYLLAGGSLYRYTAGTSGNGTWATLPGPGVALACMSFDGGDRIIGFAGTAVWAYSISGNVWTPIGAAPVSPGRAALGADGLVYCFAAAQVWAFDPVSSTIAQVGTTTYAQSGAHVLRGTDGFLYLIGGGPTVERFDTRAATTQAPRIGSTPPSTTLVQGTLWSYAVAAGGKPHPAFSLVHGPAGMTINTTTGLVSWTPALAQAGAQTAVVRATNSVGMAEQMITFNVLTVAPDVTAPTAPGSVTVLPPPSLTTNSADITWTASTDNVGVTGYRIYVRRAAYGGRGSSFRKIAATTGLTWHFANLPLCSTSTYYLAAVDAAGNRSAYSPVTIKVICVPTIYGGLGGYAIEDEPYTSATISANGNPVPTLTQSGMPAGAVWHPSTSSSGYFTWTPAFGQGSDANYAPPTQSALPGTATFTLTASNVAVVAGGSSGGSTTQSYTVPVWPKGTDLIPPAPVPGVAVNNVTSDTCHVSWLPTTDNYGVVAYRVTASHRQGRSRFHHGPYDDHYVTADLPASATDVTLTGLRASTSYVITVIARDAAGVTSPGNAGGLWSYPGSSPVIYTRPAPFAVPNVQQTLNANGSLTIAWPNQGYYWQYTVQCTDSLSPANWQPVPPVSQWPSYYINSFTFTPDPGVPQRFYRVFATPGL